MEAIEIIKRLERKEKHCFRSNIMTIVAVITCVLMYWFYNSELTRLQIFERNMKPYENYNMQICGIINSYMGYLSGIDDTTKLYNGYEKSINDLQKQNPKYDILAIDAFLKKKQGDIQ